MLPKGLRSLPFYRRARHRYGRCFRHIASRCRHPAVDEMLQAAEIMNACCHPSTISRRCGKISGKGATETGLRAGTPVVAGAGDQAAGATGMGIVSAGAVSATIGTSGVVLPPPIARSGSLGRVHTFATAFPSLARHGVTQAAGPLPALVPRYLWQQTPAAPANPTTSSRPKRQKSPPVLMVSCDALSDGRATPHLDSNARGALIGLTASHTRAHVVRAILEGVAFSLRDTFTLFREMNVPVTASALAAVAHVHRSGARSRPMSMATPWKSSRPKRAPPTEPRFSLESALACGRPSKRLLPPLFALRLASIPKLPPSPLSTPATPLPPHLPATREILTSH